MVNHTGVSIYHVPKDGAEWAKYIQEKLATKGYDLRCVLNDFTCQTSSHVVSTTVNVFLITPDFLDCRNWDTLNDFDKDTCIFVLTGVDITDFAEAAREYKTEHVLDWYILEITNTEHSVRDMVVSIISIYESAEPVSCLGTCQDVICKTTEPLPCRGPCRDRMSNGNFQLPEPLPCHDPCRDRIGSGIYENSTWDDEDDVYDTLPPVVRQVNELVEAFCKVRQPMFCPLIRVQYKKKQYYHKTVMIMISKIHMFTFNVR